MNSRIGLALVIAAWVGSASAQAQHAAPAQKSDLDDDLGAPSTPPPSTPSPAKGKKAKAAPDPDDSSPTAPSEPSPSTGRSNGKSKPAVAAPDAGPQKFKDDITPDDVRAESNSAASGCAGGGCEAIVSKTLESTAFNLRVRPSQPKPGRVTEVVLEVFEVMDPPDPEYGERKPVTGEQLVAHVEGIGRFLMHQLDRNDGAYGLHFTPTAAGTRDIDFDRLSGKPGLKVSFRVAVGQSPEKGAELREWHGPGADRYKAESVGSAGEGE